MEIEHLIQNNEIADVDENTEPETPTAGAIPTLPALEVPHEIFIMALGIIRSRFSLGWRSWLNFELYLRNKDE